MTVKKSLYKIMDDEVDFFPEEKRKTFLQDDSITLGVRNQSSSKYQKQQVYNIFSIF